MDIYNQENKKSGTMEVPDKIFKVKWNPDLVHQALLAQLANRRRSIANVKDRSEISGGGKKPWRQKGTGRARHGSIRSPIWVGGGVTFGPRREKKFNKKINKKMKQAALYSLLSRKAADGEVRIINDLKLASHKTKDLNNILRSFFKEKLSVLLVPTKGNKGISLAARNIPKTKVISPKSLNVYDGLTYKYIFFEKSAIKDLIEDPQK
ncbi:MAG: 50S ribosomal protein L4 [Patescibacteria group bacterium]|nr:50S ribosomal protein L4 [Patescibacteria group bacterium]